MTVFGQILSNNDDVIKWKYFPRYWPFVRGIHRSPGNSPHKGQWHEALMSSLICAWINGLRKQWWRWLFEAPPHWCPGVQCNFFYLCRVIINKYTIKRGVNKTIIYWRQDIFITLWFVSNVIEYKIGVVISRHICHELPFTIKTRREYTYIFGDGCRCQNVFQTSATTIC